MNFKQKMNIYFKNTFFVLKKIKINSQKNYTFRPKCFIFVLYKGGNDPESPKEVTS